MKSVGDFLASKIRRAEVADRIRLIPIDEPHAELGAPEGRLESDTGTAIFYADGFVAGDHAVRYADIIAIRRTDEGPVDVQLEGRTVRIHSSPAGAVVVHDTLRWIGRALLRRRLDVD